MESTSAERAHHLRRIAASEIERHRAAHGLMAAALDGSLATGAVWPTSDLDFTVVPPPGALSTVHGVEWGQADGIPWHKHVSYRTDLRELIDGYPESFIRPAEGEFSLDANWLLDGLAVMEVVEDPTGLLGEVRSFVSERRFAPEVWERRKAALLRELRRQWDDACRMRDRGDIDEAVGRLGGGEGLASVAAQIWIESAKRIYSSKEQDRILAEVAEERGLPEVHLLYRAALGVDEGRALSASTIVRETVEPIAEFYRMLGNLVPERGRLYRDPDVSEAWARHFCERFSIAPWNGNPAYVYQSRGRLAWIVRDEPAWFTRRLTRAEIPGIEPLEARAAELRSQAASVDAALHGEVSSEERERAAFDAAQDLVDRTERQA